MAAIHFVAIPATGTSVNPARSIGPALFAGTEAISQVWLFVVGPLVGALLITGLAEGMRELMLQLGIEVPGVKQVFYGLCLLAVVIFLPEGVWPALARKLKLHA